uniref:Putative capsid protein n=1 Tax=viral metagenome TaxID=1070528 RepID=A0A6M3K120_9ZZZZ
MVDHSWEPELTYGDTMNVGILNTVTATEVTIGTEGIISDIASGSMVPIVVNQYYEAPVVIGDMTTRQSQVNLLAKAQRESGYAIAKQMDTSIAALFASLNTVRGTDGTSLTDDLLIASVEEMDEDDVPTDNRVWIFDPSSKADLLKLDKFVRLDYIRTPVVANGQFGDIYGSPIFITNNLAAATTGSYGCYLHKEAIAFIGQENNKVDRVPQPLKHQVTINTTALWGVKEMRDTWGVPIYTRLA